MKLISFLILILLLTSQALMAANPAIIWGSGGYADNLAPTGIRMKSGSVIDDTGAGIEVNDLSVLGDFSLSNGYLIDEILDEDDMLSDSDTAVPTQQSVKAYVDSYTLDTPNTFAWFDALGVLNTLPGWQVSTVSGGAQVYLNYEADTGAGPFYNRLHSFETELTSLAASPDDNVFAVAIDTHIDRADNNFDIQGDVTNFQNLLSIENGNNYGNMSASYTQVNTVNEAGVAGNISLDDKNVNISPLFTAGNINLANASATIDGTVANVLGNGTYVTGNITGNYYGNTVYFVGDSGADYRGVDINHTGDVAGYGVGVFAGQTGQTNGYSGVQLNKSGSDVGSIVKMVDINTASGATNNSLDSIFVSDQSDSTGAKNGVNLQLSGDATSLTGVSVNTNSAETVGNYQGLSQSINLQAGASIDNVTGFSSNINNIAGTVNTSAIGGYINVTGALPSPVGLNVNMSATSTTANTPLSLSINGGRVEVGSDDVVKTGAGVQLGNNVGITATTPVAVTGTSYIAQSHPTNFLVTNDVDAGILGIGLTGFGYINQMAVIPTKTVADFNMVTVATGDAPSTGGTVDKGTGINSLGLANFGGSLIVNEFAHFRARAGSLGTEVWGISIEDPTAENYFDKSIVIGGSTQKVSNADVALEIADEKPLLFAPVDTVTRDAWTALEGMFTYNEDDLALNYYDGAAWQIVASQDYVDTEVAAVDLQTVYNQSTSGDIVVDGTIDGVSIRDNATPIADTLFEVTDNAGTGNYLSVDATGMALNSGVTVDSILDEDDLVSDSDTAIPTQQSVKAYVDSRPQGKNYIGNPTPRIDTAGWVRYATSTPSATPIDFAGTPAAYPTWTRNTTNALNNQYDFLLTKDPNDRQGEGIYYEFDIENGDKTVMQLLQFYKLDDSIYEDGDIAIFVVTSDDNFTTQNIIYPANQDMIGGIPLVSKQFQFNSTDTKGRLCIHIASGNVLSYNVQFNDFALATSPVATSAVVLDEEEYEPTFTGFGTPSNVSFYYSRVGDKLHIRGRFTTGVTTPTEARISFPSGLVAASTISTLELAGTYGQSVNAAFSGYTTREPSVSYITFSAQNASGNALTKILGNTLAAGSGVNVSVNAVIPIQGWSSTAVSSIDLGARNIIVQYTGITDTTVTANTEDIQFVNKSQDTAASWNGRVFTAPETAMYSVNGSTQANAVVASWQLNFYKDGVLSEAISYVDGISVSPFSGKIYLTKGQTVSIRSTDGYTAVNNAITHYITITKDSNPQTTLAGDQIYGNYTTTAVQSIGTGGSPTTIVWGTVTDNTSGWMNTSTGELTIGENGFYHFDASAAISGATVGTGIIFVEVYKNGTRVARGPVNGIDDANTGSNVSHSMYCLAGSVITIRIYQSNGASRNMITTAGVNTFSFFRTK